MARDWTEDDLARVRTARLRGQRAVQFADRSVTYSSDAEMRQLEQDILREIEAGTTTRPRQIFGVASKGF